MSADIRCYHSQTMLRRAGPNVSGRCKTCGLSFIKNPRVMVWKHSILEPVTTDHCECPGETPVEIYRAGPLLRARCIRCESSWAIGRAALVETNSVMRPALKSTYANSHKTQVLQKVQQPPSFSSAGYSELGYEQAAIEA